MELAETHLRLKHPWNVHLHLPVGLLKRVARVDRDAFAKVVQSHVAGFVPVPLTDLPEGAAEEASRRSAHVQRVLAAVDVAELLHHSRLEPLQQQRAAHEGRDDW